MSAPTGTTYDGSRHAIHVSHVQTVPDATEPAPQDHDFVRQQFDRSISSILVLAGYSAVTSPALHSIKALAEEFIVDFLETVCMSMLNSRRTLALPQDFSLALAELGWTAADFNAQLRIRVPRAISCPKVDEPLQDEAPPADMSTMLGPELCAPTPQRPASIPAHFPSLPSAHTWKATEQVTMREKDPRKIRERATQEGILAEQALRRLATAAKKPRSRMADEDEASARKKEKIWQDALDAVQSYEYSKLPRDVEMTDTTASQQTGPMVVNYDRAHWRQGTALGSARD